MANENAKIIVGDIGGTNVRFAAANLGDHGVRLGSIWKRPGDQFSSFGEALGTFLEDRSGAGSPDGIVGAAIGLAGPVLGGRVELLHRPWVVDRTEISSLLSAEAIILTNDFVAMARSAPELSGGQLAQLGAGRAEAGANIVVGGPGTGFGLGTLKCARSGSGGVQWVVVGGEGGHQLFAPQTELEWRLAERLRAKGIYVSNEVIASGSGFASTLEALSEVMGLDVSSDDPAEVVRRAASGGHFELELCRLRARCTMSALGDAALAANARGGVFVAGGVSPHLSPWLAEPAALARFRERGARSDVLADIPIQLITGDEAALVGAAALWRDEQSRGWI